MLCLEWIHGRGGEGPGAIGGPGAGLRDGRRRRIVLPHCSYGKCAQKLRALKGSSRGCYSQKGESHQHDCSEGGIQGQGDQRERQGARRQCGDPGSLCK